MFCFQNTQKKQTTGLVHVEKKTTSVHQIQVSVINTMNALFIIIIVVVKSYASQLFQNCLIIPCIQIVPYVAFCAFEKHKIQSTDGKKPEQATTIKKNLPEPVVIAISPGYA
jgi:hypothetical protein